MKVLLHICCGVCAAGVGETLTGDGHEVLGFFYNPNIHPRQEYCRRLQAVRQVADRLGLPLEVGSYEPDEWLRQTAHLKEEPEGGKRCELCFTIRLKKTYVEMLHLGADVFTTTLTISPHKSARIINRIGAEIGGDSFLARDFKKQADFQRTMELARQWRLYHQDYCGCVYSMKQER